MNLGRPRSVQYRLQYARAGSSALPNSASSSVAVPPPKARPQIQEPVIKGCICYRPKATILCSNCNGTFSGRIRLACPSHVNVFYMEHVNHCINCKAAAFYLKEIK